MAPFVDLAIFVDVSSEIINRMFFSKAGYYPTFFRKEDVDDIVFISWKC